MQAVAAQLGVTKMALYRYVRSKDELLAAMIELAVGDVPHIDRSRHWRGQLEDWAARLAEIWGEHPWLPNITRGDRPIGPREVAWTECALAPLTETRLTATERLDAVFLLSGHIRNTQPQAPSGTQPWHDPAHLELLRRRRQRFPHLAAVSDDDLPADNGRAFGLNLILDGIEAIDDTRANTAP